ncbi:MAG: hypothetical protein R3A46_13010 [Thermomicrobiales bacterium]
MSVALPAQSGVFRVAYITHHVISTGAAAEWRALAMLLDLTGATSSFRSVIPPAKLEYPM